MAVSDLRRRVCYIPQSPRLFNRSLLENLRYGITGGGRQHSRRRRPEEEDVYALMQRFGLDDLAVTFREKMHQSVGKSGSFLSGGQRQIVWLLRAALGDYPVVVLDEPTASLDQASRAHVIRIIQSMASQKKTVVIITHDNDVLAIVDTVVVMEKGGIASVVRR
jgi:ATP-binding cassette subfamily C protein LapB